MCWPRLRKPSTAVLYRRPILSFAILPSAKPPRARERRVHPPSTTLQRPRRAPNPVILPMRAPPTPYGRPGVDEDLGCVAGGQMADGGAMALTAEARVPGLAPMRPVDYAWTFAAVVLLPVAVASVARSWRGAAGRPVAVAQQLELQQGYQNPAAPAPAGPGAPGQPAAGTIVASSGTHDASLTPRMGPAPAPAPAPAGPPAGGGPTTTPTPHPFSPALLRMAAWLAGRAPEAQPTLAPSLAAPASGAQRQPSSATAAAARLLAATPKVASAPLSSSLYRRFSRGQVNFPRPTQHTHLARPGMPPHGTSLMPGGTPTAASAPAGAPAGAGRTSGPSRCEGTAGLGVAPAAGPSPAPAVVQLSVAPPPHPPSPALLQRAARGGTPPEAAALRHLPEATVAWLWRALLGGALRDELHRRMAAPDVLAGGRLGCSGVPWTWLARLAPGRLPLCHWQLPKRGSPWF
jgi:hypothetical protein